MGHELLIEGDRNRAGENRGKFGHRLDILKQSSVVPALVIDYRLINEVLYFLSEFGLLVLGYLTAGRVALLPFVVQVAYG